MLKFKRIISFVIVCALVLSFIPATYAKETKEINYKKEIEFLNILGVMDYYPEPEKLITRGQFAELLVNLTGVSSKDLNEPVQLFYDVPVTHEYFQAISYCARRGWMSGCGNNLFNPDYKILAEEAVTAIVRLLGYTYLAKSNGDGFTGYIAAARELGLLSGISLPYGQCIFTEEVAKLLYNSLEIPLVMLSGISDGEEKYSKDQNKNILSEYHKIAKAEGLVTATEITGIFGFSPVEEDTFVLGGYTYKTKNKIIRNYLGYEIEILYSIAEENQGECIVFYPKYDMKKVQVKASDFVGIEQGEFKYVDENEKDVTLKISQNFDFIHNGQLDIFDVTTIEDAEYGYFELLSSERNSTYDIIKFNDYKTLVVDSVVASRGYVQGNSKVQGSGALLLDYNPDVYDTLILDKNGDIIDISTLSQNDVLAYYVNGEYIFGYVTHDSVSGVVTERSGTDEIYIDGKMYTLAADKADFYSAFKLNDYVTIFIDFMGNIAGALITDTDSYDMYIPIKLCEKTVAGDDVLLLKAYDIKATKIIEVYLADSIKLNTDRVENTYSKYADINNALFASSAGTPAVLRFNSDGKVNEIETPRLGTDYESNEDGFTTLLDAQEVYYRSSLQSYANKAYGNSSTKYLLIPADLLTATDEDFVIVSKPSSSTTRVVYAYTNSKYNKYATLVMFKNTSYFGLSSSAASYIVTRVTSTVNEDGENCKKIYYTNGTTESSFLSKNDDLEDSLKVDKPANYGQAPVYVKDLKRGDIIRFGLNNKGYLVSFDCLYKADIDTVRSKYQTLRVTNRVVEGTVKDVDSSFLTLDLTINTSSKTYNDIEHFLYSGASIILLKNNNGTLTFEAGSAADILDGDRVMIHAYNYKLSKVFVFK